MNLSIAINNCTFLSQVGCMYYETYPGFFIGGGHKPQITCNDVIINFQKRNFL